MQYCNLWLWFKQNTFFICVAFSWSYNCYQNKKWLKNSENRASLTDKFFVTRTNSLLLGQILCYLDKFFVTDVDKFLVTSNKEFVRQTRFVLMKLLRKTKMFVHLSYVEKAITNEKIIHSRTRPDKEIKCDKPLPCTDRHTDGKLFIWFSSLY